MPFYALKGPVGDALGAARLMRLDGAMPDFRPIFARLTRAMNMVGFGRGADLLRQG